MVQWYNAYKKGEGAIQTQKMYQNCINNHINTALGSKKNQRDKHLRKYKHF